LALVQGNKQIPASQPKAKRKRAPPPEFLFNHNMFKIVIFDESQTANNEDTMIHSAILEFRKRNNCYSIAMSGSPYMNSWKNIRAQASIVSKKPFTDRGW
jgi:hypothetical protein